MKTYEAYLQIVEQALPGALDSLGEIPSPLREAMQYSLQAGGKRLRPVLLLAATDLLGGDTEEALPFACALEMIHTYSLIHDDLPAMDDDDLRRGRPSCHKAFGEAVAILAGDGLLSAAAEMMLKAASSMDSMRGTLAAKAIMSRAGVCGMVAGQTVDVTMEGTEPTAERVAYIHRHKTGDLLTAPLEAAACLAGADMTQREALLAYGESLGLAFQMADDLLDVEGDAEQMGKKTGLDAAKGKLSWVALRGVEGTRSDLLAETERAKKAISELTGDVSFFISLADEQTRRWR